MSEEGFRVPMLGVANSVRQVLVASPGLQGLRRSNITTQQTQRMRSGKASSVSFCSTSRTGPESPALSSVLRSVRSESRSGKLVGERGFEPPTPWSRKRD
jgi:hypothetical protein